MNNSRLFLLAISVALLATASLAQERRIKRSGLPPAVEKTVAVQSRGALIRGFSEEKEDGQIQYEVELTVNGHGKDVAMDPTGVIIEVEEEVAMDSLPPVVMQALQTKAGKGKIVHVESITKHDKIVAYEADVTTGGKKSEVQVGPDGKPLDHEE